MQTKELLALIKAEGATYLDIYDATGIKPNTIKNWAEGKNDAPHNKYLILEAFYKTLK